MAWDVPGLKPHGPDIAVIFGVHRRRDWRTFDVAVEGVRPSLIIEVTWPETRQNDLVKKVEHYARAGVPHYVIADAYEEHGDRRLKLIAYRLGAGGYEPQPPDDQGRVWLEPVGLWLGIEPWPEVGGERLACYDPETGERIGNYTQIRRALTSEAQARALAEVRVRQLEAEIRRLTGEAP